MGGRHDTPGNGILQNAIQLTPFGIRTKRSECRAAECRYTECHYAECYCAECHYVECLYAECRYTESQYAECHYAECRGTINLQLLKKCLNNEILTGTK